MTTVRLTHVVGAAAIAIGAVLAGRALWPVASAAGSSLTPASNVAVNCEPGQQALVRQTVMNGEPHVAIQCVSAVGATMAAYGGAPLAPAPAWAASDPRLVPASYIVEESPAPRVIRAAAPTVSHSAPVRSAPRVERRSWKKTALVIGGSAGAGAGIGALIGGKKGALIGAAVGGGGAGLYEALKK